MNKVTKSFHNTYHKLSKTKQTDYTFKAWIRHTMPKNPEQGVVYPPKILKVLNTKPNDTH